MADVNVVNTCFTRPISLPDLSYALGGSRHRHKQQVVNQCVIEGSGVLSEAKLQSAIEKVAKTTPACRMVIRNHWGFKHWRGDGPLPRLKTIHYPWDGYASDGLPFLDGPLDLFEGPVVEVIQVISQKTFLVFRIHHAVMDGVASNEFIRNVFRALRNETPDECCFTDSDEAFIQQKRNSPVAMKLEPALSPLGDLGHAGEISRPSLIWRRITLPSSSLVIMPKTMLALAEIARKYGSGLVRFRMPVDLRRHQPGSNAAGNLIGVMLLDVDEQDSVRSLVKKLNRQLSERRDIPKVQPRWVRVLARWIPFFVLEVLAKYVTYQYLRTQQYHYSATLSSVAATSLADYSTEQFTAKTMFGVPIAPMTSAVFVAICSNPQTTEITIGANSQRVSQESLIKLCDELEELLLKQV